MEYKQQEFCTLQKMGERSGEKTSLTELFREEKRKANPKNSYIKIGISTSLGFCFPLQYSHPLIPAHVFESTFFRHVWTCSCSPPSSGEVLHRKGKKQNSQSLIVPFSVPTPIAKHQSSPECSLRYLLRYTFSLLQQWNSSQLKIKLAKYWSYGIAVPTKAIGRFSSFYLHVHLSPKDCLLAIAARTQLFHNANSEGGIKYCQDLQLRTKHLWKWQWQ